MHNCAQAGSRIRDTSPCDGPLSSVRIFQVETEIGIDPPLNQMAKPAFGDARVPRYPLNAPQPLDRYRPAMEASAEAKYFDTQTRLSRITLGIVHDPLTGLRSHAGLLNEIARDDALARRIDSVNSIVVHVHLAGGPKDKVLALVGMRIARSVRVRDTAAHLGGGSFVVIVADETDVPVGTAARLKVALSFPFVIDGQDVVVNHKIGFARLHHDNLLAPSIVSVESARLR